MSRVAGPSPVTTRLTLCASCAATLPPKAKRCPTCGASRPGEPEPAVVSPALTFGLGVTTGFKFGAGLAIGAVVVAALAWLGTTWLLGPAQNLTLGSPEASMFSGTGSATSEVVHLTGTVDVAWTAGPGSASECRHRALIHGASRPNDAEVIVDRDVLSDTSGAHVLYGLVDTDYVIDVDSSCQWTFRFKPRP